MVGLFNFVLIIPLFFILNYTGYETFELPSRNALLVLTLNAILGTVISDFCWAKSVVLNGPLITTLGICLTIPISILLDWLQGKR
jgi:solute carrier family 35 protein F5